MLANYTALSSVRALLGVGTKELPDAVLQDTIYDLTLQAELRRISSTLAADFLAAVPYVDSDDDASNFVGAMNLFAAYFVAKRCLVSLPQFAPRSMTDGKAGFIRHTDKALVSSAALLIEDYAVARADLVTQYAAYAPTATLKSATVRSLLGVSSPSEDIVEGE
jgi:hypothetical protein